MRILLAKCYSCQMHCHMVTFVTVFIALKIEHGIANRLTLLVFVNLFSSLSASPIFLPLRSVFKCSVTSVCQSVTTQQSQKLFFLLQGFFGSNLKMANRVAIVRKSQKAKASKDEGCPTAG